MYGENAERLVVPRAKQFQDAFLKYLCFVNCPHCAIFQDWHMGRRWVYISAWKLVRRRLDMGMGAQEICPVSQH